jgi:hypothetical protein
LFASVFAHAQAAKPCEELKDEIAKKVEASNVKSYSLEIVAKDIPTSELEQLIFGLAIAGIEGGQTQAT